jgi:hypothetical protein
VNKKKQKNFIHAGAVVFAAARPNRTVQINKSFLILFSKKNRFPN